MRIQSSTASHSINSIRQAGRQKYDIEVDKGIVGILQTCNSKKTSRVLKEELEKWIGRTISSETYSRHISQLLDNKIIIKDDRGRGKQIFYSLSHYAKTSIKLKLLSISDPEYSLFEEIYSNLLFPALVEGEDYWENNLEQFLSDIGTSRNDVEIESIEKVPLHSDLEAKLEKYGPFNLVTHFKPIKGVRIVEQITYREKTFSHAFTEHYIYEYNVPGISIEDFSVTLSHIKIEDIRRAFKLLLDNEIIRPYIEFRGQTRYVLTDDLLADLVKDLNALSEHEDNLLHEWHNYHRLPYEKLERINAKYFEKDFRKLELTRHENRKWNMELMSKYPNFKRNVQQIFDDKNKLLISIVKALIEKHSSTLKRYDYLSTIFKKACPTLSEELTKKTHINFSIR